MPLVAGAGAGIASEANTHFALNAREGMTNQRAELEACAVILMALDCKLEVRLDIMWVKTGVEHMLSWTEKEKQPTFRTVWRAMWENLCRSEKTVLHSDMSQVAFVGQM